MPTRKAKEPSESASEAIASLEERVDAIATAVMGTEEFAKTANLAANLQLRMQKGMAGHMARQLALFNMPSRDDLTALAERVMTMDERLVRIEELLARLVIAGDGVSNVAGNGAMANGAAAPRPARTRKPKPKVAAPSTAKRTSSDKGASAKRKTTKGATTKRTTKKTAARTSTAAATRAT